MTGNISGNHSKLNDPVILTKYLAPIARFETISGPRDVITSGLFQVDNCFSSLGLGEIENALQRGFI